MKYRGSPHFHHDQPDRTGVLITNLGTPDAPTTPALRRYLAQFLRDPRVVEMSRPLWWLILHGVILRLRPRRSAAAYRKVFDEQGSPLLVHTRNQAHALAQRLGDRGHGNICVEYAMRYGNPSIEAGLQRLFNQGVRRLLLLPLYPQYSATTTASTFDALAADFQRRRWLPELRMITHYHDYPAYIRALVRRIRQHWESHPRPERLLFSYHGIPLRYLHNGDPYHCECFKTSRLVAEALGLEDDQYMTVFQSRFGREEWLKPYIDETLKRLPGEGVQSVQVICPGFSADCLETLEEIAEENRDYFLEAGGQRFEYISALNDRPEHIDALTQLVEDNLAGWPPQVHDPQRQQRAMALGAGR